jgi:hypothetical protein
VRVCSDCLYERVVKERDEARAEVERLRANNEVQKVTITVLCSRHVLRRVAERQRDADIKAFVAWLREVHATGFPHKTPEVLADAVDAGEFYVPLVTEEKP